MTNKLNRRLQELLKKMEPRVAREFQKAAERIANSAQLNRLIAAIERGDVYGAIATLDLDQSVYADMVASIRAAYGEAGALVVANTVWRGADTSRINIYWNATNPRAERWLSDVSSTMVTRITNEMRDVIAETIRAGYSQGMGPRNIALDLVGRVGANGRRSGGVVGLSRPQAKAVEGMLRRLRSGEDMEYIFTLQRRDKRFDSMIRKAINGDIKLIDEQINRITGRYSDRLLKLRGDTIARTETAKAVEAARQEAFAQWKDKSGVSDEFIIRRWDHAGGGKSSRDWHVEMDGMTVRGMDTPFVTPRGARMMYPCDTSLGAGAAEVCNCRCQAVIEIDYKAMAV